ncbi:MAG: NADPH-dependent FMN reductase [Bacteroidetes bacterium MED-G21]|nr:MAG: NADPH-dependent FMN reductase [Bacteroidetes bacterium MED-G21]
MITIISATNRLGSITYKVAMLYSEVLSKMDVKHQIFDLSHLPNDFIFSNFDDTSTDDFVKHFDKYIIKADRFIVISPEYHGSYPGIFKAFIDCIGNEGIKEKKVALVGVSSGRAGNLRGLDHLSALFHHLRAEVYSSKSKLSLIHKLFNEQDVLDDSDTLKLIQNQINGFLTF